MRCEIEDDDSPCDEGNKGRLEDEENEREIEQLDIAWGGCYPAVRGGHRVREPSWVERVY